MSINNRVSLVSLNIRTWRAEAHDRAIASQAENSNFAEHGTMTVIKRLTPSYVIKDITNIAGIGRTEHYRMTLPSFNRGQQILTNELMMAYTETQGAIKGYFEAAVDRFMAAYPKIKEQAPKRLGDAYRESDFPSDEKVREYFSYQVSFMPMAVADDWRLEGIDTEKMAELRATVETTLNNTYKQATRDLYERVETLLESMVSQCNTYNPGKGGATLRDATIRNLKQMAEMIPLMNFTMDPILDEVGRDMAVRFGSIEASEIRKTDEHGEKLRTELRDDIQTLIARLRGE